VLTGSVSGRALAIGEDFTDHMPCAGREHGVGVLVARELDERYRQRPAAASLPGGVINPSSGSTESSHAPHGSATAAAPGQRRDGSLLSDDH